MKLVCISTVPLYPSSGNITIGKVYDTDFTYNFNNLFDYTGKSCDSVIIINDVGVRCKFNSNLFDTLENIRNNKLTTIGIV